jgi:tetratricopeptide (TPR) repeat protein
MKEISFLILLFGCSFLVSGQNVQKSEQDVQTESVFIEAIRNKLIDRHDLSIPQFRELIKKQPENHVLWYELGYGLMKTKRIDEAIDAVTKAISLFPNHTNYLELLADLYQIKQDFPNEINVYRKLQNINPYKESYYTHWVDLLIASGKKEEAVKVLSLLEENKGINEISSLRKASLLEQTGKNKDAESELLKLNASFSNDIKYLHALASFYSRTQKSEKANAVYHQILGINPADDKANLALAAMYKNIGQDDQYLQALQSLMDNGSISLDAKIMELIPYLEKAINKKDKALITTIEKYASNLVLAYPDEAKTHALYGDVLSAEGRDAAAYSQYQESLKFNRSIKSVWIQFLLLSKQFDEPAIFLKYAEQAFDLFPNEPMLAIAYTQAMIRNGDIEGGKSMVRQALLMSANHPVYLETIYSISLGLDYLDSQNLQVTSDLAKIKSINAKSFQAIKYPIEILLSQNKNLETAAQLAVQGLKEFPHHPDLEGFLGMINYRQKKFVEAKSNLEFAVSQYAENAPAFHETYGDALFMLKDVDAALAAWKKAAEINPFNARVKKKILDKTIE